MPRQRWAHGECGSLERVGDQFGWERSVLAFTILALHVLVRPSQHQRGHTFDALSERTTCRLRDGHRTCRTAVSNGRAPRRFQQNERPWQTDRVGWMMGCVGVGVSCVCVLGIGPERRFIIMIGTPSRPLSCSCSDRFRCISDPKSFGLYVEAGGVLCSPAATNTHDHTQGKAHSTIQGVGEESMCGGGGGGGCLFVCFFVFVLGAGRHGARWERAHLLVKKSDELGVKREASCCRGAVGLLGWTIMVVLAFIQLVLVQIRPALRFRSVRLENVFYFVKLLLQPVLFELQCLSLCSTSLSSNSSKTCCCSQVMAYKSCTCMLVWTPLSSSALQVDQRSTTWSITWSTTWSQQQDTG